MLKITCKFKILIFLWLCFLLLIFTPIANAQSQEYDPDAVAILENTVTNNFPNSRKIKSFEDFKTVWSDDNPKQLLELDLSYTHPQGEIIIHDLPYLEKLYCHFYNHYVYGKDVTLTLYNLPKLKTLVFHSNLTHITDIKGLDTITSLEELNFKENQLTKIEGLETLTNLKSLNLNMNRIEKLEGLSNLINLEYLSIGHNNLKIIEGLSTLTKLKELNVWGNKITDIDASTSLPNLNKLNLEGNLLTNIDVIQAFKNLEELYLTSNKIIDAKCLQKLKNLEKLELSANQLKGDISYLQSLTSLKTLKLGSYQINNFSAFQNFSAPINELNLSNTGMTITDIQYIASNEFFQNNLITLSLMSNDFKNLNFSFLSKLRNLDRLYIMRNNLSHIEGLEKTRVWIYLSHNCLPLTEAYKAYQLGIIADKQEKVFFESMTMKVNEPLVLPEQEMLIEGIETGIYVTGPVIKASKTNNIIATDVQPQIVTYKKNKDYKIINNSIIFRKPGQYYVHMISGAMPLQRGNRSFPPAPSIFLTVKTGLITVTK